MKRKNTPKVKRFVSAALALLTMCGNFVFTPLSAYAQEDDDIVYLQDVYLADPDAVAKVGCPVYATERTVEYASGNVTYSKALRQDTVNNVGGLEESSMTFTLSDMSEFGGDFIADVGMMAGDKYRYGDAIFKVYIDDVLAVKSEVVSYKSNKTTISCYIPASAKTLKLATDCYDDTACDWCVWGDPRIEMRKDAKTYLVSLTPTEKNKVQTGYGSYAIRYEDTLSREFTRSIYNHAAGVGKAFASVTYDVETMAKNGAVFKSYIGLVNELSGSKDTNKYGRASFLVYADDVLLSRSEEITPDSPLTAMRVEIPSGTKKITLAQDPGTSQSCDWCMWGDPYIYPSDIAVLNAEIDRDFLPFGETGHITVTVSEGDGEINENAVYTAVFESGDETVASVDADGVITGKTFGKTEITCTVTYGEKTVTKIFPITVTAGSTEIYLADIDSANSGEYVLRYADTGRLTCEKGIYIHAGVPGSALASASYDISSYTASAVSFHSTIGFLATNGSETDTAMRGLASFAVYADGTEIAKSDFISPQSALSRIDVLIPKGTKSLKIAVDPGEKRDFDWCLWGDPYIAVDSDYQNRLAEAVLFAEKTELAIGETQTLSLTATLVGGNTVNLSEATVVYESSDTSVLSVENGVVTALSDGTATVCATVYYNASEAKATLRFRCGSAKADLVRYLSDMAPETASVGWGSLILDRDLSGNKIHFAGENGGITCEKGLMTHAQSELVYNIERFGAFAFRAVVGITDDEAAGKGLVQFFVYADNTLLYQSAKMTNVGPYEEIDVTIPNGTKSLRLVADKCGDNASDHSAWGDARIIMEASASDNVIWANAALSRPVMTIGQTASVSVTGTKVDGSALTGAENITYQSDNTGVFSVNENGVVTALSDGIGYLTVTVSSGNTSYTVKVRVIVGQSESETLYHFASPDGSRTLILSIEDGTPLYTLIDGSDTVIENGSLGMVTDKADFSNGLTVKEVSETEYIEDTYTLTAHTKAQYDDPCSERRFTFTKDGAEMTVIFRLYDDGMALRYILSSSDGTALTIKDEATSAHLPENATVWAMPYTATLEGMYGKTTVGYLNGSSVALPLLAQNGEKFLLMTESGINPAVSGTRACGDAGGIRYTPVEKNTAVTSPFTSTWRVLIEGTLAEVTESSLVTAVSDKPDESIDFSFVETGVSSWSWDEVHFSGQADPSVHKKYIDYAAEMGWKYYTLDYGWQLPDGEIKDGTYTVLPGVHYDWVPDLIEYANSKGVKLIGWVHRVNLEDEEKMNAILEDYKALGLAGIKADFFNSESRETMEIYDRLYRKCAELGLVVNCHGANKPTGEVRRYPNVIAREGIKGDEYNSYDGMWASQYTIIPFLRGVVGPADVTEYSYPRRNNKTTCGSQVAISILVASGLHYLGTPPEKMADSPVRNLYQNFPSVFDDSFLLDGSVGDYAVIGRRSGNVYYVAGITTEARTVAFGLDFLSENKPYFAEIYKDGKDKNTLKTETRIVYPHDTVSVDFLENGGALIKLTPVSELTAPSAIALSESGVALDFSETTKLAVTVTGDMTPGALLYTSQNEEVARFENGTVYAVGAGVTTVRVSSAKDETIFAECRVCVRREKNSVSEVAAEAPERVEPNEKFTVSFAAQSGMTIEDISFIDGNFSPVTVYSREEKDGQYIFTVSVPFGDEIGFLDSNGKEIGFFTVRTSVAILYDDVPTATAYSGESITLESEKTAENLLFIGWKIGEAIYAAGKPFTVPFGIAELHITAVYTNPSENVTVYIDSENGNDEENGLTATSPVQTVSRAFALLNSYSAEKKVLSVIGTLSPERNLPSNDSAITVSGYNGDSVWNVGADGIAMNGDLRFENIRFELNTANKFFDTYGHALHIGKGVKTDSSPLPVIIHSGTMNQNGPRESVTIDSGSFTILAGAFYNVSKTDETNGADYTINGGTVKLNFYADRFADGHHGAVFTDTVNVLHNGGSLTVTTQKNNNVPISFEKAFTLIQNGGMQTTVSGVEELCENGYYVVFSENRDGCSVGVTDKVGRFAVTVPQGINAFADKQKIVQTFTAQSGKAVYVTYRPDKAARIGDDLYDTLADAFADASFGETVVLLQNAVTEQDILVPSGVKADFDGFTLLGGKLILSVHAEAHDTADISDSIAAADGYFLGIHQTENEYTAYVPDIKAVQTALYFDDIAYTVDEQNGAHTATFKKDEKTFSACLGALTVTEYSLYANRLTYCGGTVKAWYANGGERRTYRKRRHDSDGLCRRKRGMRCGYGQGKRRSY